jgi:aminoglycoside phosphotransferase (APT) family kinase protein
VHLRLLPRPATDFQQPPTAAEITAFAARLLGPDTAITEAVELGGGAFNNTFRLTTATGHRSILRLSPPPAHPLLFHVEHHLLRREHSLTPFLASIPALAPLLPRTLATDFSHEISPRDAILSEFIEGENWDAVMPVLTPADNDALWRQLAALLRHIHATPAQHFGWTPPATSHTRWSDFILGNIRGLLVDCKKLGVPATEAQTWATVAERCAPALDLISEPRVLHGDPWPKNVLIRRDSPDGAPRIVALLDHERGGFGDPQSEWVFHGCDFPPVFWEAYGPRPTAPASQIRANLYRGTISIQCILESTRYAEVDTITPRRHLSNATHDLQKLLAKS